MILIYNPETGLPDQIFKKGQTDCQKNPNITKKDQMIFLAIRKLLQ